MATSRPNEIRRFRVIVALNACRRDLGGLELAAHLAASRGWDLEAWFVEEVNLLNVADLPFTKEITRTSAVERDFDSLRIERAQRSCLTRIRQAIDRLNKSSSVRADLRILRGHLARTLAICDDDIALLILSCRGERPSARTLEVMRRDSAHRPMKADTPIAPICVVIDGSEGSWRAMQAALEIASSQAAPLTIVFPVDHQTLAEDVRQRVVQSGCASDLRFRMSPVEFDPPTLLRSLRQSGCRLLVLKRRDGALLELVADAAECPVVLV